MTELVLDQTAQRWAQLQLLQSHVVDQILSGDTSQDWECADLWLGERLRALEPTDRVVFTPLQETAERTPERVWARYQAELSS
jgi:hypothetical protein